MLEGAKISTAGWNSAKPKIIEFYGHEGEDFRHFKTVLETFFSLNGITQDQRRVVILRTQLRRAAATFFDNDYKKKGLSIDHISYQDAISNLEDHYITEKLVQSYELAFSEMSQATFESPTEFLSRLYEAAELAEIYEDKFVHSRFRAGLLPEIKTFCRGQSAGPFAEWVKHSTGWWNAHSTQTINLVDNPFVPSTRSYLTTDTSRNALLIKNDRLLSQKDLDSDGNVVFKTKPLVENFESPTIAALTAKLDALDLKQLVLSSDNRTRTSNDSSLKRDVAESFKSDKSVRSLVKSIVQEIMEDDYARDRENGFKRYGKKQISTYQGSNPKRRPHFQDDMYYDNDNYNPGEGYYKSYNNRNNYDGQDRYYQNGNTDFKDRKFNNYSNNNAVPDNNNNQGRYNQGRNNYQNGEGNMNSGRPNNYNRNQYQPNNSSKN